jgi:hypothetical protein
VNIQAPGEVLLEPTPLPDGRSSAQGKIRYDPRQFTVDQEDIFIQDARLGPIWGERLTRIMFNANQPKAAGQWALRFIRSSQITSSR